ncbi:MAG: SpoIID/LytB domain-containing protein, partial [Deltaproteobacteria bacterium]|nr:SpoIID/LytB domain-containing protein [Deltaproteobacteria bacterium]
MVRRRGILTAEWEKEPKIDVGVMDQQTEISGHLEGIFHGDRLGPFSGPFSAKVDAGRIMFCSESLHQPIYVPSIRLISEKNSLFSLSNVIIGNQFHWERKENQTFQGDLILHLREDGTISAINEISLEDYLESVISSEMSGEAHIEFLKAHAILSRSWLLAGLSRKKKIVGSPPQSEKAEEGEIIRWYDREDHDLYDVCADDHCQRYQGISKSAADNAQEAVRETHGRVLIFQDEICDARYSKCCGGLTENFNTAWADIQIPYLTTVSDAPISHQSIRTEEEATRWVLSPLEAYCRVMDEHLLERILSGFDQETKNFFRWKVEYPRKELEEILRQKSGFDF